MGNRLEAWGLSPGWREMHDDKERKWISNELRSMIFTFAAGFKHPA
jgi:hypothetical protein